MKTVVNIVTPVEELPTSFIEDKYGYTYFPKTGGEYRITKDVDGKLRTNTLDDVQALIFQNDLELEFPEIETKVPGIKLEHYSGWTALWLSYVMIIGEVLDDVSTQDLIDDILMTCIDSITMGILATNDGIWYNVPMYDQAVLSVEMDEEGMPHCLLVKSVLYPDKIIKIIV